MSNLKLTVKFSLTAGMLLMLVGMNSCSRVKVSSYPTYRKPAIPLPSKRAKPTQRAYKIKGKTYYPIPDARGFTQCGLASWYGPPFHGRKTSNGETYDMNGDTAAHKTLPMGTHVLVRNLENGRKTIVRINDRGPFIKGRIIDLSKKAAREIGIMKKGIARVELTALGETVTVKNGRETVKRFVSYPDFQKGKFYIRLGSFQYKENSLRLKKRLEERGMLPVIVPFQHDDNLFYRVQVSGGGFLDQAEHRRINLAAEFPGAFVIRKD